MHNCQKFLHQRAARESDPSKHAIDRHACSSVHPCTPVWLSQPCSSPRISTTHTPHPPVSLGTPLHTHAQRASCSGCASANKSYKQRVLLHSYESAALQCTHNRKKRNRCVAMTMQVRIAYRHINTGLFACTQVGPKSVPQCMYASLLSAPLVCTFNIT